MRVADYVMKFLVDQGVKHVFTLPGGGSMYLVDALGKNKDLTYVCNLHEQACAIAADTYAQYTNNLGVALVTTGPGGTNAVTGVAASWIESSPSLFISGQVPTNDMIGDRNLRQRGMQELDIISIVKPITKYAVCVKHPRTIRHHLEKAVYLSHTGHPGPVWIDIPLDVQSAEIDENELVGFLPEIPLPKELSSTIQAVMTLLQTAERPVILAGNGVRLGNALPEFYELVERLRIPVLVTWKCIDYFDENDPLYVGRPGILGSRYANFIQQNADLVLILGARLHILQTTYNSEAFAPKAKKVMVNIDKEEIYKLNCDVDIPVIYDVKDFIVEMLKQKPADKSYGEWWKYCRDLKRKYPIVCPEYRDEIGYVNNYAFIETLSDLCTPEDVIAPGASGQCSEITLQAFKIKKGQRVISSQGLGAMGFGIPSAIAACLASGKRTICVDGDGGFQMNLQELEVVNRLQLPIKFFILNNQGYGSIRNTQRSYFEGNYVASTPESGLTLPKLNKIAFVYDIPWVQIHENGNLGTIIGEVLQRPGPILCEVMINPNQLALPRVTSRKLVDGSMLTYPMENMYPFLDQDELEANMLWKDQ